MSHYVETLGRLDHTETKLTFAKPQTDPALRIAISITRPRSVKPYRLDLRTPTAILELA